MVKRLALAIPQIRRVWEERNKFQQDRIQLQEQVQRLQSDLAALKANALWTTDIELKKAYTAIKDQFETRLSQRLNRKSLSDIRGRNGAQSMTFMVDMLPHIWGHFKKEKLYSELSWLDVGPGSGYGLAMLAALHSGPAAGYQLSVSAIDIRETYKDLIEYISDDIKEFIVGDIFQLDRTFDFVSASHVIEHVPEPSAFVRQLQNIARKRVFVLTPWKERTDIMTKGHINIFDERFIEELGNPTYHLIESMAWGSFLNPPYKMLFLDLPAIR